MASHTPSFLARAIGSVLAGALLLTALGACKDPPPPPPPPAPRPPPPPPIVAPRSVMGDGAFDLIPTTQGAVFVWGQPGALGGGVQAVRLSPIGGAFGDEVRLWAPPTSRRGDVISTAVPIELSAAAGGGRVVVAWVTLDAAEQRVRVTHGSLSSFSFAPALDWGRTEPTRDARRRSALAAAAAPDGTLSVLYRSANAKCEAGEGTEDECAALHIRRVGGRQTEFVDAPVMHVPAPCASPIVGYLWAEGTWHYGVCSEAGGAPETTLYAIQFDPEYALAERVLRERAPLGIAPAEGGVVVAGRATGFRDLVRFSDRGRRRAELLQTDATAKCTDGRPVLTAKGKDGSALTLALTEPLGRLEALLPNEMVADGARAVWTGRAILVAIPMAGEVTLRRYECLGADLDRTDL